MGFVRVSAGTICALALAAALAACSRDEVVSGTGRGTVVSVDVEKRVVVLDHGKIPGVMGAMKMSFQVKNPQILEGIAPGQNVEFEVERLGDQYRVRTIRPLKE
jgi:Cu/Ag efflux protein CusF